MPKSTKKQQTLASFSIPLLTRGGDHSARAEGVEMEGVKERRGENEVETIELRCFAK